jgi:acetate kinase
MVMTCPPSGTGHGRTEPRVNVLVLNPGSSTLKWAVFEGDGAGEDTRAPIRLAGATIEVAAGGMAAAARAAVEQSSQWTIDGVGCRIVHGGSDFREPTLVDDRVLERIHALSELAPLHNPPALEAIEEVRGQLRGVPIVAVFDTAFHQTLPPVASTYAVRRELGVRRYGFHGISYSYVTRRLTHHLGPGKRLILCHLGNGASICAVAGGKSIDTSMGFTPMEGLVMGTRSGDLDPGVILFLLRKGMTEADIDDALNHRSGLLGISGTSGDVRTLEASARKGDAGAELALEAFAYRASKYIAAYAAALNGVDALVFTAGIGEHSSFMRKRICSRLSFMDIVLDDTLNDDRRRDERRISRGKVEVWVIPTDEEAEIARVVMDGTAKGQART